MAAHSRDSGWSAIRTRPHGHVRWVSAYINTLEDKSDRISLVKKKWAINSAFMVLYAFASVLIVWVVVSTNTRFAILSDST
jgi:hypothetical protein